MQGIICIEPLGFEHAEAVQALASDPAIGATSNVPSPYPANGAVTWIRAAVRKRAEGLDYCFAVIGPEQRLVGACSLIDVDMRTKSAELGYWIGRPYWGKGYATAAGRLVVDFGFRDLGLRRIHSNCLNRNRASYRVLEKLGFRMVGIQTNKYPKWGPSEEFANFEIRRHEWQRPIV